MGRAWGRDPTAKIAGQNILNVAPPTLICDMLTDGNGRQKNQYIYYHFDKFPISDENNFYDLLADSSEVTPVETSPNMPCF
jgi:hypothetical protein